MAILIRNRVRRYSSAAERSLRRLAPPLLFLADALIPPLFRLARGEPFLPPGLLPWETFLVVASRLSCAAVIGAIAYLLCLAYLSILRAYRSLEHLTCLLSLDRSYARGLPFLNCNNYKNGLAWLRLNDHITMFVKASMQSWGPLLLVFLLLLFACVSATLLVMFLELLGEPDSGAFVLFTLHLNAFSVYCGAFVLMILYLQVRTIKFVDSQINAFDELRLGLTQQQWLASRDKQHHLKPTAETARAAEHIRLSFALLEHLSLTLARKGTPFELFGVQVNGGHFRALLSVLSAAVATALVRYIAVSQ